LTDHRTILCIALMAGMVSLTAATALGQTDRTFEPPPPGRLVDVGGWRMHIHCTGASEPGKPSVILEAGAGGFSLDWMLVQEQVSTFARVCSYDRSGSAWSDLGPAPHTMRQIVYELHTLLERAEVAPPYILAGQSLGGRLIRLFAANYPGTVAGMVFVDAGHDDNLLFINGKVQREWETATGQAVPAVKTSGPLRLEDIPAETRRQLEKIAQQMSASATNPPYDKLPPAAQAVRRWALAQPKHYAANNSSFAGDETAAMRADRLKSEHPLGDIPIVVVTRGVPITSGPQAEQREKERREQQADLVRLSRNGKQVIATRSGHQIHIDEPNLVAGAIRDVLTRAQR
jgi:pimeloyl-ACP methyl ester carboxylesterase